MIQTFDNFDSVEIKLAKLSPEEREKALDGVDPRVLQQTWQFSGRPDQLAATNSKSPVILFVGGRGCGKSLSASQFIRDKIERNRTGHPLRFGLVSRTSADVSGTIVKGESGLIATFPAHQKPQFIGHLREVRFHDGSVATTFSSQEPDQLRGPQFHYCFPAGTQIRTPEGESSIETLKVGDLVMTRIGPRQVTATGSRMAKLATVHHDQGTLTGTLDHPVWTTQGWCDLNQLQTGDILFAWEIKPGKSALTDMPSEPSRKMVFAKVSDDAVWSGKKLMGPFLQAILFTILTTINLMIVSKILCSSLIKTTHNYTLPKFTNSPVNSAEISWKQKVGDALKGFVQNVKTKIIGKGKENTNVFVSIAEKNISQLVRDHSTVVKHVSISDAEPVRVYNVSVEEKPEYFADGILVHNSVADELASWDFTPDDSGLTAWRHLNIATRLGMEPQIFAATTPRRVAEIREMYKEAEISDKIHIITGASTYDNPYLSATYMENLTNLYEGTRLGLQELRGQMLADVEGALWSLEQIEQQRMKPDQVPKDLPLCVIGVDPSVAEKPRDECGIIVCKSTGERDPLKRHAYVVADHSLLGSPSDWAKEVVKVARAYNAPVIAERNQGGALIKNVIHTIDPTIRIRTVHARQGKELRAEPVTLAYDQGRVSHVGTFARLEDQLTTWVRQDSVSPDRMDALVYSLSALVVSASYRSGIATSSMRSVARRSIDLGGRIVQGR